MASKIYLDYIKINAARKALMKNQAEMMREFNKAKRLTEELASEWKGDSSGVFKDSAEVLLKNFVSVILEFNELIDKLDFAVETSRQAEIDLKARLEAM
ncbi:MAG: WXG100 family type VII secretion target [Clostridiales Family XIII bacterium]|nr:WXG100 family type VII secretion target [Clostridiales Family XIII bacterium]